MKVQPFIEKLSSSAAFMDFKQKYGDAFLVAGFFILDFETGNDVYQIDYYIPSKKKVGAFTVNKKVDVQILETVGTKTPEKLDSSVEIDTDALRGILDDEMKNRNITEEVRKIIAVIQTVDGKKVWILNCILTGMEILKAHIDDKSQTVLKMEKASVLEYMKKVPMGAVPGGQQKTQSKEEIDKQIKALDKLKEALNKEKSELDRANKKGKPEESAPEDEE